MNMYRESKLCDCSVINTGITAIPSLKQPSLKETSLWTKILSTARAVSSYTVARQCQSAAIPKVL